MAAAKSIVLMKNDIKNEIEKTTLEIVHCIHGDDTQLAEKITYKLFRLVVELEVINEELSKLNLDIPERGKI